jgi:maltose alpha-D-glucosyltransferase/alpha-amylase
MEDPASARVILAVVSGRAPVGGALAPSILGGSALLADEAEIEPRKLGRERQHTTLGFGTHFVLKLVRRLEEGASPEVEVGRFLAAQRTAVTPPLLAHLELRAPRAEAMTIAVLHGFVPNIGTAWEVVRKELGRYYERVLARGPGESAPDPPTESPLLLSDREPPTEVAAMIGSHREMVARLGARVAELHLSLTARVDDPAFAPEPYSALHLRSKYQSLRNLSGQVLRALRERLPSLPASAQREAEAILARGKDIASAFEPLLRSKTTAARIRGHGNLHLGHALFTGKDFVLTDLNDFRALPPAERRRKRSPLRDLAWIVQSLELATFKVLLDPTVVRESDLEAARPWALHWTSWTCAALLRSYIEATAGSPVLAVDRDASTVLFEAFRFERALYQLQATLAAGSNDVTITLLEIGRML